MTPEIIAMDETGEYIWVRRNETCQTAGKAKAFVADEIGAQFIDIGSVRKRHMRPATFVEGKIAGYEGEDYFFVCNADNPKAIPVWEVN